MTENGNGSYGGNHNDKGSSCNGTRYYKPELRTEKPVLIEEPGMAGQLPENTRDGFITTGLESDIVVQRISKDLYADPQSGIRELYANEARACREAMREHGASPEIVLAIDTDNRSVVIEGRDSSGMSWDTFKNVYCVLGRSTNFDGSTPGQFGFGRAAYMCISDIMILETWCRSTGEKYAVMGKSGVGFQTGLPEPRMDSYGTRISMTYRKDIQVRQILIMARKCAALSGVPTVIHIRGSNVQPYDSRFEGLQPSCKTMHDLILRETDNANDEILQQQARKNEELACHTRVTDMSGDDADLGIIIDAWNNWYCHNYNMKTTAYLCGMPINYKYNGIYAQCISKVCVNIKDERKYRPTPDRERLSEDAGKMMDQEIDRMIKEYVGSVQDMDVYRQATTPEGAMINKIITRSWDLAEDAHSMISEKNREVARMLNCEGHGPDSASKTQLWMQLSDIKIGTDGDDGDKKDDEAGDEGSVATTTTVAATKTTTAAAADSMTMTPPDGKRQKRPFTLLVTKSRVKSQIAAATAHDPSVIVFRPSDAEDIQTLFAENGIETLQEYLKRNNIHIRNGKDGGNSGNHDRQARIKYGRNVSVRTRHGSWRCDVRTESYPMEKVPADTVMVDRDSYDKFERALLAYYKFSGTYKISYAKAGGVPKGVGITISEWLAKIGHHLFETNCGILNASQILKDPRKVLWTRKMNPVLEYDTANIVITSHEEPEGQFYEAYRHMMTDSREPGTVTHAQTAHLAEPYLKAVGKSAKTIDDWGHAKDIRQEHAYLIHALKEMPDPDFRIAVVRICTNQRVSSYGLSVEDVRQITENMVWLYRKKKAGSSGSKDCCAVGDIDNACSTDIRNISSSSSSGGGDGGKDTA